MGTQGMKTSLVSREVIADSIELTARGYQFDAIVALSRLRQDDPRLRDGAGPARRPLGDALRRLDRARPLARPRRHDPRRLRGDRRPRAGDMTDEELHELEGVASPGAGACGGQFTANTMACAFEALGISAGGSAMVPAEDDEKGTVAEQDRRARDAACSPRTSRPSKIITRDSLENAIACVCASGGSTNGVLHLLAVAHEARHRARRSTTSSGSRARTPLLADLKPGGRFVATDLYAAGGVPVILKRLAEAGVLHGDAITVTGRTIGEEAAEATEAPGPGGRAAARRPAQARGRPGDPARQPRPRGRRGQARRHRAHAARPARRGSSSPRRTASARSRTSRSSPATSS